MLVGKSAAMVDLRARVTRIGRTGFTVLIEGESGAGKELVAREIHRASARSRGPFIAVNCAALVETLLEAELFGIEEKTATGVRGRKGKFELADEGTLFLDEIGDLSLTAQAKLLRVLQDMTVERVGSHISRTFDTRIVAATNRRLEEMVAGRQFRADLYYRLSGVEIPVPPLRQRTEDIPLLIGHFLRLHGPPPMTISPLAVATLCAYDWPGNVRQLARVIERAIALASRSEITVDDLPEYIRRAYTATAAPETAPAGDRSLRAWSSLYVRGVLERCQGNKRRACDILDISYHTLQAHLSYGLQPPVSAETRCVAERIDD